jgi:hypothetical protein
MNFTSGDNVKIGGKALAQYIKDNASVIGFSTLSKADVEGMISSALSDYATKSWVEGKGYFKSGSITSHGSATCSIVDGHSHTISIYG